MKRILYVLLIPFIVVFSCAKDNSISMGSVSVYESRGNSVSISDVRWLVSASEQTKGNLKGIEIIPCVDKDNDTLAFAVNYEKGWKLFSADKRVPPILAECGEGNYNEIILIPGVSEWLERTMENIKIIKSLDDEMLNFTEEEIRSCQEFWNQTLFFPPVQPSGHYERGAVYYTDEVCDSIPHLMVTKWHQHSPFNAFCPFKSNSTVDRCPAGCVAISGAQVLYYHHYLYGVPECAPSSAYCNGDEEDYPNYDWDQTQPSSEIWDEMPLTGTGLEINNFNAAPFIAKVGKGVRMKYKSDGSGTTMDSLKAFMDSLGIISSLGEYAQETIKQNLINGQPVIVGAENIFSEKKHSFVIDGYLRKRTIAVTVYRWVWDSPGGNGMYPIFQPEDMLEMEPIGLPYIDMVRMNWGWSSQWNGNDAWYSLTDLWYVSFLNPQRYYCPLNMIYNISASI